jgi:hypothetical protein
VLLTGNSVLFAGAILVSVGMDLTDALIKGILSKDMAASAWRHRVPPGCFEYSGRRISLCDGRENA